MKAMCSEKRRTTLFDREREGEKRMCVVRLFMSVSGYELLLLAAGKNAQRWHSSDN